MQIENITKENFTPFGTVYEYPVNYQEQFYIVDQEEKEPWRIALFRYTNKTISLLENHPYSKESFEPLQGVTILVVAENNEPQNYKAFLLDKAICLKKGIWHQVLSLTPEAQVKITENLEVSSEFYTLQKELIVEIQ